MKTIKVILVDDEPIALEVLQIALAKYEHINIVGSYTKPFEALKEINDKKPDVIFLDMEMGEICGIEAAKLFVKELENVKIVFITAYSQYAVDAFEVNAVDYLLKPIQEKRMGKTLERLNKKINEGNYEEEKHHNKLTINSFGSFEVIDREGNNLTWRTQKAKELFAYLWVNQERVVSKLAIMDEVFSDKDSDRAATLLHTTIYQLRRNLEKLGYKNSIIYFSGSYQLNIPVISDMQDLNRLISSKQYGEKNINEILKIYKEDFLEAEGYHWSVEIQKIYSDIIFNILEEYSRKQLEKNLLTTTLKLALDRLYRMDSFNEDIVNLIIDYYGKQGNRTELKDFFNKYVKDIWRDMRLKPSKYTLRLYKKHMGYE